MASTTEHWNTTDENAPRGTAVRVFLTGVSCVGKTTIGRELARSLSVRFFDLDEETETFFGTSLERLHNRFQTIDFFRNEAAKVLSHVLADPDSEDSVIALPVGGLMGGYLRVIRRSAGVTVALHDKPQNILERIFDVDFEPAPKSLTSDERRWYLQEINRDIAYFSESYQLADLQIDISGMGVHASAQKVREAVHLFTPKTAFQETSV